MRIGRDSGTGRKDQLTTKHGIVVPSNLSSNYGGLPSSAQDEPYSL
jgi:hypothetical protein